MIETQHLTRFLDNPALSVSDRTLLRCDLARDLMETGDYEGARQALDPIWHRVGDRPALDGLDERAAAEVFLRAGTLSGWIGSARQLAGAQETAKDLLSESMVIFESLGLTVKAAEAQIELAWCYWREGSFDEARLMLREALSRLGEQACDLRAIAMVRHADVESAANRLHDALEILARAAAPVEASSNHSIKGRYHNALALVLKNLGVAENRADYLDRALVEFTAASFHFEQAGHKRYQAAVENNLGFLFSTIGRYAEAHQHLDRAQSIFESLKDNVHSAQVSETRARVL